MDGHSDSNVRLIPAVQQATRRLASKGDIQALLLDMLAISREAVGASHGTIYLHDPETNRLRFQHVLPPEILKKLPVKDIPDDFGVAGQAFQTRKTVRRDYPVKPREDWNEFEKATGFAVENIIATPLSMQDEEPLGVIQLINKVDGNFNEADVAVMDTLSAVATMAVLNARLVEEQTRASTLLGMGKVSHDLGNLAASLYATLSFGDMAMGGLQKQILKGKPDRQVKMYVDALEPIFRELKDAVDRIVGYSQLISDLSAGRTIRPQLKFGSLSDAVHQGAMYFEDQGRSQLIDLKYDIEADAPDTWFDELFVIRIVQNLVGNAIKAVRETYPGELPAMIDADNDGVPDNAIGEVIVRYQYVGQQHVISVTDTGPGMTSSQIQRALAGDLQSQWEKANGSGWGLRIVRELTAALGGQVDIHSEKGHGATFAVHLPALAVVPGEATPLKKAA